MAYRVRSVRSAVFRKERNENGVVKMVSSKRRSKLYIPPAITIYGLSPKAKAPQDIYASVNVRVPPKRRYYDK
jgi:hypothetical protein